MTQIGGANYAGFRSDIHILGMFACNTVLLYTIKLMMIIQGIIELGYNIGSAWFLDIRISTCSPL